MLKEKFNELSHLEKIQYLQSDISATMIFSFKYQILLTEKMYKFIIDEELLYRLRMEE